MSAPIVVVRKLARMARPKLVLTVGVASAGSLGRIVPTIMAGHSVLIAPSALGVVVTRPFAMAMVGECAMTVIERSTQIDQCG